MLYLKGEKMNDMKSELEREVYLRLAMEVEGVKFVPQLFEEMIKKNPDIEIFHLCMDYSFVDTVGIKVPYHFRLEHGIGVMLRMNDNSPYELRQIDGEVYAVKDEVVLSKVFFDKSPKYYHLNTSDGTPMRSVARSRSLRYGEGFVLVGYSEVCALGKGEGCLFCNINTTISRFGDAEGHVWKNPKLIAETLKAAYDEGFDSFVITGGFFPGRKELDYYVDVARLIREETGLDDFNGTAVIGAPSDLNIFEHYKEAGFRSVAIHPEVWGERFFNAICPGKARLCGGFDVYKQAIDHALAIFGKGRVRSQFVAGLQPKSQLLEGLEELAGKGVVAIASPWVPNIGSEFEGHRTPTVEWHWEIQKENYNILRKNGITTKMLYDVMPEQRVLLDLYRINDGFYPIYPAYDSAQPNRNNNRLINKPSIADESL
jgi:hypothetical protein